MNRRKPPLIPEVELPARRVLEELRSFRLKDPLAAPLKVKVAKDRRAGMNAALPARLLQ